MVVQRAAAHRGGQPKLLVILDMNGVLVLRNKTRKDDGDRRPFLAEFLQLLFVELADRIQVAVWSSMMEHNLHPLVELAFGCYCDRLAFVWDQRWCTEKWVAGMHKPLLRKDLVYLKQSEFNDFFPHHVLLIDDDPIKCTANPTGTAVHPSAWEGDEKDAELRRLGAYLKALVESSEPAPEFQRRRPFRDFLPQAAGEEELQQEDEEQGEDRPAKRQRLVSSQTFAQGEEVEGFWPDDDSWLAASVLKALNSGDYRIKWAEDGTESIVPPDFLRLKVAARPPKTALRVGGAKAAPSPWKRMESKRSPGVYYYYSTSTGASQAEPPAPWQVREVPGRPGQFRYVNLQTGERSDVKPVV